MRSPHRKSSSRSRNGLHRRQPTFEALEGRQLLSNPPVALNRAGELVQSLLAGPKIIDTGVASFALYGNSDAIALQQSGDLRDVPLTGGSSRLLDTNVTSFALTTPFSSPLFPNNGKAFVITLEKSGDLWEIPLTGGSSRLLEYNVTSFALFALPNLPSLAITNLNIVGADDVIALDKYGGLSYIPVSRNLPGEGLATEVTSFTLTSDGVVIAEDQRGSLWLIPLPAGYAYPHLLLDDVTSFAFSGNNLIALDRYGNLWDSSLLSWPDSQILMSNVVSFALAGNGKLIAVSEDGGLDQFTQSASGSFNYGGYIDETSNLDPVLQSLGVSTNVITDVSNIVVDGTKALVDVIEISSDLDLIQSTINGITLNLGFIASGAATPMTFVAIAAEVASLPPEFRFLTSAIASGVTDIKDLAGDFSALFQDIESSIEDFLADVGNDLSNLWHDITDLF